MISQDLIADEQFNRLSTESQNMFIRMLSISDDCGVVPANTYRLSVLTNTGGITKKIPAIIQEIVEQGLGCVFDHNGEPFFAFKRRSFEEYQSYILKKATKSEYLRIPREEFLELSKNFQELPRCSGSHSQSAVSTVESREQQVESRKQKEEGGVGGFEELWKLYPKPVGKKDALRHYLASVKSPTDVENIQKAIENYRNSGNVQRGFVQNGSTWFNNWQDWVSPTEIMMKGNTSGPGKDNLSSQERRASFNPSTPERLKRLEELKATLDERDRMRGERSRPD